MSKLSMYINGTIVYLDAFLSSQYNVLQHCDGLGIEVPRFCYHDHLSIAGNCRMCLVESGSAAKPVLACSTEISPELEIYTNSILVKQAREQMLEFLLINHPLDCPICDQGGECDLQDLTYIYGSDRSRYAEDKRGVSPFYFGPLVKVVMTRCIQCTRCVRFFDELVGITLLGSTGRGTSNTITTYVPTQALLFTYSMSWRDVMHYSADIIGNVADICPVGALTIRPSAYTLRTWEIISTETIDPLDSLCSNIRIDTIGVNIVRVLPRLNASINNEWITDKIRFVGIGLAQSRSVVPTICSVTESSYAVTNISIVPNIIVRSDTSTISVSWDSAYSYIARCLLTSLLNSTESHMHSVNAYAGGLLDLRSMFGIKLLCASLGVSRLNMHTISDTDIRTTYLCTDSLYNVFNTCNILFFFAVNIRKESPVLNIRVSNAVCNRHTFVVCYVGSHCFTPYNIVQLGTSVRALSSLFSGRSAPNLLQSLTSDTACTLIGSTAQRHTYIQRLFHELMFAVHYVSLTVGSLHAFELDAMPRYNARSLFVY